jgi:hypothetical protein
MKGIILTFAAGWFAFAPSCASAGAACARLRVKDSVQIGGGELTLADLLSADTCLPVRMMAARISLGVAPLAGTVRVLERSQVRGLLEELGSASGLKDEVENVPAKIVVQRWEVKKSCAAIAGFALRSSSTDGNRGPSLENFDCAAAQSIPEDAALELTKSAWNPALRRWEFSMRCARAEDCVPFLVWAGGTPKGRVYGVRSGAMLSSVQEPSAAYGAESERLIKAGQTAILRWDEGGIRIVLPVTCLEGGALGQTVRVRFKNAGRILRAEILSDGTLRAGL